MSGRLPEFIDPIALAQRGASGSRTFKLERFSRLAEHLLGAEGEIEVSLDFRMEGAIPVVSGHVTGALPLQCQRCMGEMRLQIDHRFELGAVFSDAEGQRLPAHLEPLLVAEEPMPLVELLEDELLLLLPIVPMHAEGACKTDYQPPAEEEPAEAEVKEEKENPFAVLSKLKH